MQTQREGDKHPYERFRDVGTYIYQADEYCSSCGLEIAKALDEGSSGQGFDSGDYPKPVSIHEAGPRDYWAYCEAQSCQTLLPGGLTHYGANEEASHYLSDAWTIWGQLDEEAKEEAIKAVQWASDPDEAREALTDLIDRWEADGNLEA